MSVLERMARTAIYHQIRWIVRAATGARNQVMDFQKPIVVAPRTLAPITIAGENESPSNRRNRRRIPVARSADEAIAFGFCRFGLAQLQFPFACLNRRLFTIGTLVYVDLDRRLDCCSDIPPGGSFRNVSGHHFQ